MNEKCTLGFTSLLVTIYHISRVNYLYAFTYDTQIFLVSRLFGCQFPELGCILLISFFVCSIKVGSVTKWAKSCEAPNLYNNFPRSDFTRSFHHTAEINKIDRDMLSICENKLC